MRAKSLIGLFALIITAAAAQADTMMLYRTIVASATNTEAAEALRAPETEVVSRDGAYYVVQGWHDHFEDALPSNVSDPWNKVWRHVLPVEVPVAEAESRGFQKPELLRERAQREMSSEVALADPAQLRSAVRGAVEEIEVRELQPGADIDEVVALLAPQVPRMVALTENAANREDAEFAQLWLAKTFYEQGLAESTRRLPQTSGMHERHAWPEEELAYESAMAEFKRFLELYPDSEHAEEAAYHIAATSYHLTYKGHHRLQVQKAKEAYEWFIEQYPNSERVPRAKLNLLGIALELARMDDEGYEEVIEMGEALLAAYPGAGDYISSRARIIVAEALYDGYEVFDDFGKFEEVVQMCDDIIEKYNRLSTIGVIGSAHRLRAQSNLILKNYKEAAIDYSILIEIYNSDEFQFSYEVRKHRAASYYFRGIAFSLLGLKKSAIEDFLVVVSEYNEFDWLVVGSREMLAMIDDFEN